MLSKFATVLFSATVALASTAALAADRTVPAGLPKILPKSMAAPVTPQLNAPRPQGTMMAPKMAKPGSVDDVINALTAVKASKGGKVLEVPLPEGLRLMLKNPVKQGAVTPKPTGGDKSKFSQVNNTEEFPYATMGLLGSGCTGTLVAEHFVLTAAMCIYDQKNKKFYDDLDFYPGINGDKQPFGKLAWKDAYVPKGFTEKGDTQFDFGLVVLEPKSADEIGWMGMGHVEKFDFKQLTLTGYPWEGVDAQTMWQTNCTIDSPEKDYVFYRCPGKGKQLGAMTGSPLWFKGKADDAWQIVGIHVTSQDDKKNSWWAQRLNAAHTETILSWANGADQGTDETPPEDEGTDQVTEEDDGGGTTTEVTDGGGGAECTCDDQASPQ